jgi:predicted small lipoprotein YifL
MKKNLKSFENVRTMFASVAGCVRMDIWG